MLTRAVLDVPGLIAFACNRIFCALETSSHRVARDETGDAADALHYAAKLAPEPQCTDLFRLSLVLKKAMIASIGHPSAEALQAVSAAAELVRASMARVAA